ncbi:MAG: sugar ABC transporter permease [Anaerolineae bacterium]|nr:sugar ABC transporter permease [Anaerolineae bacterium]
MSITIEPAASLTKAVERPSRRWIRWSEQVTAYLFLLPALLVFGLFAWFPILKTIMFSFQKVSLNAESTWIGLTNFQRMLADPAFGVAWQNSLSFAMLSIAMGFLIPIIVSIMINEMRRAKAFFRLVYFLPTVIPITVSILIWRLIYAPDNGVLNAVIIQLGGQGQSWLQDSRLVKPAIIILLTWANFGSTLLIYLAALQDIAPEQYEAAEIEGASVFERIRYITLPHLYRTMVLTFVLQVIAVVQIFTEPFLLTQGGPGNATLTPVLVIYRKAFLDNDFGLASAWSFSLIVILSVFSFFYLRLSRNTTDS